MAQLGPDEIYVRNVDIDIYREGQLNLIPPDQGRDWVLNASVDFLGQLPQETTFSYVLTDESNNTISQGFLGDVNKTAATITGSTTIPSSQVELWWPNGLGPQTLYNLTISIQTPNNHSISTTTRRTGFRTIVLNEFPISQAQLNQGTAAGNNWHFEINGHAFYAKGSNFIPPDSFWPRVTRDKMARLFDSVVDGNQNMLRVWASGAYSPDFLYELADERGILLWSEFEFGDALYPVGEAFLEDVGEEARFNVRRVNHHRELLPYAYVFLGNWKSLDALCLISHDTDRSIHSFTSLMGGRQRAGKPRTIARQPVRAGRIGAIRQRVRDAFLGHFAASRLREQQEYQLHAFIDVQWMAGVGFQQIDPDRGAL